MLFRHIMSTTQQLIPIHNTNVHKNKSISLNVAKQTSWLNFTHIFFMGSRRRRRGVGDDNVIRYTHGKSCQVLLDHKNVNASL